MNKYLIGKILKNALLAFFACWLIYELAVMAGLDPFFSIFY